MGTHRASPAVPVRVTTLGHGVVGHNVAGLQHDEVVGEAVLKRTAQDGRVARLDGGTDGCVERDDESDERDGKNRERDEGFEEREGAED